MDPTDGPSPPHGVSAKRKLAAILHADVVGFSRLMGEDEDGTHARLMAHRQVIDELISRHDGRVVGSAGDAVLADFPSVVEALSAAVDIQAALATRNSVLAPDKRLEFRIGINLGDVIVDGDDIFGDGVNVAARIESLADPGGIAISGTVHDLVRNKLDLAFHNRGPHRVKNIAEPVRVYSVGVDGGRRRPWWTRRHGRRAVVAATATALLVAGVGAFRLWGPAATTEDEVRTPSPNDTKAAATTPQGKPTIAVLPFKDHGGDPAKAYFSDGLTEDVIADLGRFSNLLVLSWNAVAPYKGKTVALDRLSRDLNVRYVVGGTVRRLDDRLRVTVQLSDAERGVLLWSERYDESLDDVFAVQDQISRQVVGALAVRLTRLEQDRAHRKPTDSLDAYDHVLRGRGFLRRIERGANLDARAMFERAGQLDARYGDVYVGLGFTRLYDFMYGWTEWPERAIKRARELAERAVEIDEGNAAAHALLAHVLIFLRQYDRAAREIGRAIELNPNNAMSLAIRGRLLLRSGRPEPAAPSLELALRLDPRPVVWWPVNLSQAYYFMERYDDAIRLLVRFGPAFKEDPTGYAVLAAAHGQLGRLDEAARAVAALKRLSPFFNAKVYASGFARPAQRRHLADGFRKAGLD